MKLELKHLAPYLPYGLKIYCDFEDGDIMICQLECLGEEEAFLDGSDWHYKTNTAYKPILRPLSDLTDDQILELDNYHNFSIIHYSDIKTDPTRYPYTIVQKLLEWHFDVFGLIDAGLAIDINTLEK